MKKTDRIFNTAGYSLTFIYAFIIIIPVLFIILSAFKDHSQIVLNPISLPNKISFEKFIEAEEKASLIKSMLNTVIVVITAEILNIIFGYPAAYAISRIRIFPAKIVEAVFGSGFLIPPFAIMLPVFLLAANLNVLYEPGYLILFYAVTRLPLTVILFSGIMKQVPGDFEDAAKIDGANILQILTKVFFPMTSSITVTVIILNFIYIWNEYLFALILLPAKFKTIQLSLPLLKAEHSTDYALISAGILLSLIPIYIFYAFFQERIVKGLTAGGIKG